MLVLAHNIAKSQPLLIDVVRDLFSLRHHGSPVDDNYLLYGAWYIVGLSTLSSSLGIEIYYVIDQQQFVVCWTEK